MQFQWSTCFMWVTTLQFSVVNTFHVGHHKAVFNGQQVSCGSPQCSFQRSHLPFVNHIAIVSGHLLSFVNHILCCQHHITRTYLSECSTFFLTHRGNCLKIKWQSFQLYYEIFVDILGKKKRYTKFFF